MVRSFGTKILCKIFGNILGYFFTVELASFRDVLQKKKYIYIYISKQKNTFDQTEKNKGLHTLFILQKRQNVLGKERHLCLSNNKMFYKNKTLYRAIQISKYLIQNKKLMCFKQQKNIWYKKW